MKRALIPALVAMSVVLVGLAGFLAWKKFMSAPHAAPAAQVEATAAAADGAHPTPTQVQAGHPAEAAPSPHPQSPADAHAAEAAPADPHAPPAPAAADPHAAPPAPAAAAPPAPQEAVAAHHDDHGEAPAARPPERTAAQLEADRRHAEAAAAAAIFSDRPPTGDEPAEPRAARAGPRIPTLRLPNRAVAQDSYLAASEPQRGPSHTAPPARAPSTSGAGRGGPAVVARAPVPRTEAALASALAPAPEPAPFAGPRLPGVITGMIRDGSGLPLAGASVLAVTAGGDDAVESATDDDGTYLLVGLRPGRYLLFAGLGGASRARLPARSVEVVSGGVARVNLREPVGGTTVRVKVVDDANTGATGQALLVAGAAPSAASLQALLASDAIFFPEPGAPTVLRKVPAGVYTLVYLQGAGEPPRAARQRVMVRGEEEQQIELRLPGDLAAR